MNRENFSKLADHLETTKMGFHMGKVLEPWRAKDSDQFVENIRTPTLTKAAVLAMLEENGLIDPPCGTAGCLMGHIHVFMFGEQFGSDLDEWRCAEWLGLTEGERRILFYADDLDNSNSSRHLSNITKRETINHLRYVAEGGEIGWKRHLLSQTKLKQRLLGEKAA